MAFRKIKAGLVNGDVEQFIGEIGNLFFDITDGSLRLSDGETPGGNIVSGGSGGSNYTLPTATTTVKGGVKIDGTTIAINNQVISVGTVPYSSLSGSPTVPTNVSQLANDIGFITGVSWTQVTGKPTLFSGAYADLSGKPTLFSGSYTDLTNKPTIPDAYTLPTATDSILGGVKIGSNISINAGVISVAAPFSGSYNDLTNKPTLFDGAYASLSGKPTIPSNTNQLTNGAGFITTADLPSLSGYATLTGEETLTNKTLTSPTITDGVFQDTFSIGNQVFYEHGYNGFSVNEDWDIVGESNFTGYHYTSGAGRDGVAFTLARTGQFTTGFGIHGTSSSNEYVIGSETANTDFVFKSSIGMPFDVSGGTELFRIGSNGSLTFSDDTVQETAWLGSTNQILWINPSPTPQTLWRNSVTANSTGATISLISGLPGVGLEVTWTFDEDKIKFPDNTEQTTAFTGSIAYASVTGTPTLATVATSGSYTDLTSKPTIPAAQIQSDWNQATDTALDYIKNKPTIPTTVTVNGTSITLGSSGTVTAAAGTLTGTTLNSTVVSSSLTSVGTLTSLTSTGSVTANHTTAFIAGDNAISNVALQIPREGAIRNLYNGSSNNMYFDVSIGGTPHGQFQFRSSSAFTNILTMSPTAFNVNTDAVVTAKTASFGRLPWNSALDTELTIDDYRFRINNNAGSIYPQIISNVSGQTRNSAWTSVAAISGQAIGQGGSTGNLVPNNAWTNLYTFASMNSAGDTVTTTLQDKQNGRIYRITFMRSDNGTTTGYNIIGERLL